MIARLSCCDSATATKTVNPHQVKGPSTPADLVSCAKSLNGHKELQHCLLSQWSQRTGSLGAVASALGFVPPGLDAEVDS